MYANGGLLTIADEDNANSEVLEIDVIDGTIYAPLLAATCDSAGNGGKLTLVNGRVVCRADEIGAAGSGDVTDVGDCSSGACFNGTSGTTLTFNNAGGDATLGYDGTDFDFSHTLSLSSGASIQSETGNGHIYFDTASGIFFSHKTTGTTPLVIDTAGNAVYIDGTIITTLTGGRCLETTASGAVTVASSACGSGGGNSFETIAVPAGTNPVADSSTDTLTITETSPLVITGTAGTDTIDITWTTLTVAEGGTGATTLTDGGILLGSGTGAITALGVATNGQIPIGDGTTDPVLAAITGTANQITVTNGAGSITLSTPQDIHTAATPSFAGLNIDGSNPSLTIQHTGQDEFGFHTEAGNILHAKNNTDNEDWLFVDNLNRLQLPTYRISRSFVITGATASSDAAVWRTPNAITIRNVHCVVVGGTNVIGQLAECDQNGLNCSAVDASDLTCVTTNVNDDGSLSNASIDAEDYVGWITTSVSGTNTRITITFEYTVDLSD